jgi:hypothetical protein
MSDLPIETWVWRKSYEARQVKCLDRDGILRRFLLLQRRGNGVRIRVRGRTRAV